MIIGIGMDIVEIDRIKEAAKNLKFPKRILSKREYEIFSRYPEQRGLEFLAGRFAAKEAFSKAYGSGIGQSLSFQDIEILPTEKGAPEITIIQGELSLSSYKFHVSITHSNQYAAAQVIIESLSC